MTGAALSPLRISYYHGGPAGLRAGDRLTPPSVSGRRKNFVGTGPEFAWQAVYHSDRVYITTCVIEAARYAANHEDWGAVYEVEPIGLVEIDPEEGRSPGPAAFMAPGATVLRWVRLGGITDKEHDQIERFKIRTFEHWVACDDDSLALDALLKGDAPPAAYDAALEWFLRFLDTDGSNGLEQELVSFVRSYAVWYCWRLKEQHHGIAGHVEVAGAEEIERLIDMAREVATETAALSLIHGPNHWRAVALMGELLADRTDADREIVRLFAVLHDTRRRNDGHDPNHGRRAAYLARKINGNAFDLDDQRLATLTSALARHADGATSADPTIGACWDADRLQFWRFGEPPSPDLMSTDAGRELIGWSGAAREVA